MYFYGGIHRVYSFSLVLLMISLWFCRKMLSDYRTFEYSRFLIGFMPFFYFVLLYTSLNDGLTGAEAVSIIRYTIFFPFILVIYDMYKPRYTVAIFISLSLPFILSSYYLFSKYLHVRSFLEFLDLYRMKPAGIFSNANAFGVKALFAAPFWIALAIWSKKRYYRIITAVVATVISLSILLTNSRSAIVGLMLAIIFYFIVAKKVKYLLAIAAIVAVIFMSSPFLRTVVSAGLRFEHGGSNREVIWKNSINVIKQNPLFGVGTGNFPNAYKPYLETTFDRGFIGSVAHAHNEILHTVAELGVVGLFIILVLFYVPLKRGFQLIKKPLSSSDRAAVYGLMGILFANVGNAMFDANTLLADGGLYPPILYWITMIIILKLYEKYESGRDGAAF
jgi:O-antigen ligase